MAKTFILLGILIIFQFVHGEKIKIGITHWNDVSGQLESFDESTATGTGAPKSCATDSKENCVGGLVQMVHWINDPDFYNENLKKENIFRINAGNFIGGESGWLPCFENGWVEYAKLLKTFYEPDVSALGMKEFGAGVGRTNAFVGELDASTVTVANTCSDKYEDHKEEKSFCEKTPYKFVALKVTNQTQPTTREDKEDLQIGIIGFTNPTVEKLSLPGQLVFSPIVESLTNKIKDSGLKTFIAIGDGPLSTVKEILNSIDEVKMVIYSSGFKAINVPEEYPVKHEVEGKSTKWYVTAGRYGSSVGKLILDWDTATGNLSIDSGKLVKTSNVSTVELGKEAKEALESLVNLENNVTAAKTNKTGQTRVTLTGGSVCWREECNLGNLMTDAMVHCAYKSMDKLPDYPIHSIWHGGAFFDDLVSAKQPIFEFDIHKWLPYHNRAHLVSISGTDLWKVFNASAGGIDPDKNGVEDWRQFLQVSNGIKIVYENGGTVNVTQIKIINDDSDGTPKFEDVPKTEDSSYKLVIPTYLYEGRGVYEFAKTFWKHINGSNMDSFAFDDECLDQYIRALEIISVGIEERIWIETPVPTTTLSTTTESVTAEPTTTPATTEGVTTQTTSPPPTTESVTPEPTTAETTPFPTEPTKPSSRPTFNPAPKPKKGRSTAVTVIMIIVYTAMAIGIIYIGYFKVLPKLRNVGVAPSVQDRYPQNQL